MKHKYHPCEQYSEEWMRMRMGMPTASSFSKIITPEGKPTRSDVRAKYKFRLVAERLLQQFMDDHYETYWMRRGSALEEQALEALRNYNVGIESVMKVGFYTALDGRIGASPDGIIVAKEAARNSDADGIEIKCPAPYTQVEYLIEGPMDAYKVQMQGQMYVCRWQRIHFWSWHPSMPPVYTVFHRDDRFIARLVEALEAFCLDLDKAEEKCRGLGTYKLAEQLKLSVEMEMRKSVGEIMQAL